MENVLDHQNVLLVRVVLGDEQMMKNESGEDFQDCIGMTTECIPYSLDVELDISKPCARWGSRLLNAICFLTSIQ